MPIDGDQLAGGRAGVRQRFRNCPTSPEAAPVIKTRRSLTFMAVITDTPEMAFRSDRLCRSSVIKESCVTDARPNDRPLGVAARPEDNETGDLVQQRPAMGNSLNSARLDISDPANAEPTDWTTATMLDRISSGSVGL
jgi:hypothetical protein